MKKQLILAIDILQKTFKANRLLFIVNFVNSALLSFLTIHFCNNILVQLVSSPSKAIATNAMFKLLMLMTLNLINFFISKKLFFNIKIFLQKNVFRMFIASQSVVFKNFYHKHHKTENGIEALANAASFLLFKVIRSFIIITLSLWYLFHYSVSVFFLLTLLSTFLHIISVKVSLARFKSRRIAEICHQRLQEYVGKATKVKALRQIHLLSSSAIKRYEQMFERYNRSSVKITNAQFLFLLFCFCGISVFMSAAVFSLSVSTHITSASYIKASCFSLLYSIIMCHIVQLTVACYECMHKSLDCLWMVRYAVSKKVSKGQLIYQSTDEVNVRIFNFHKASKASAAKSFSVGNKAKIAIIGGTELERQRLFNAVFGISASNNIDVTVAGRPIKSYNLQNLYSNSVFITKSDGLYGGSILSSIAQIAHLPEFMVQEFIIGIQSSLAVKLMNKQSLLSPAYSVFDFQFIEIVSGLLIALKGCKNFICCNILSNLNETHRKFFHDIIINTAFKNATNSIILIENNLKKSDLSRFDTIINLNE